MIWEFKGYLFKLYSLLSWFFFHPLVWIPVRVCVVDLKILSSVFFLSFFPLPFMIINVRHRTISDSCPTVAAL